MIASGLPWQPERASPKARVVTASRPCPARVPLLQLRQEHTGRGRLKLWEARVVAELAVVVALVLAVVAQPAHRRRDLRASRYDQSSLANCARVLRRIEAKAAGIAPRAGSATVE